MFQHKDGIEWIIEFNQQKNQSINHEILELLVNYLIHMAM